MLRRLLGSSPIAHLPIRVRRGLAQGANWSFFPCTAYWRGTHEPLIQERLCNLWDWQGRHIWDLGAHYGLFAIGLALRAGPQGSVAAFEPNPLSFQRLRLHALRNPMPWLQLFPFAVGSEPARLPLIAYEGLETTSTHLAYEGESVTGETPAVSVPVIRLDDMVAAGAIQAPDFIKLDVEGHGHHALRGAKDTIVRKKPTILTGLHSEHECSGIRDLLLPLGYRVESVENPRNPTPSVGGDYLWRPA